MTQPKTSDESDEWGDDNGYIDLTQIVERHDLASDASEQPTQEDDNES